MAYSMKDRRCRLPLSYVAVLGDRPPSAIRLRFLAGLAVLLLSACDDSESKFVVTRGLGEVCDAKAPCDPGLICSKAGVCVKAGDVSTVGEGMTCDALHRCDSGLDCVGGKCTKSIQIVGLGVACDATRRCGDGLVCSSGTCVEDSRVWIVGKGMACDNAHRCDTGLECVGGQCVETVQIVGLDDACDDLHKCGDGLDCSGNVCVLKQGVQIVGPGESCNSTDRVCDAAQAFVCEGGVCVRQKSAENTEEACRDQRDNDGDGRFDCLDPDCVAFCPQTCGNDHIEGSEDCDGTRFKDGKTSCHAWNSAYAFGEVTCRSCALDYTGCGYVVGTGQECNSTDRLCDTGLNLVCRDDVCERQLPPENTAEACGDRIDNDGDGRFDCFDPDCASFCPQTCGNDRVEGGELCDGEAFKDGKDSCSDWDSQYNSGRLSCDGCELDLSECKYCLTFWESEISSYAYEHWDTDNDKCISREEAAAVTEIPKEAFKGSSVQSLWDLEQFPNLLTIGESAFKDSWLRGEIDLPQVRFIEHDAFWGNKNITSVRFENAVFIGTNNFKDSKVSSIYLPNVREIKAYAFGGCNSLTSVELPKVTSIRDAFQGCEYLRKVDMPMLEENHAGFRNCTRLSEVNTPNVKIVGYYSFENCTSLESVNFPKAQLIGQAAFHGCTKLTSVNLPEVQQVCAWALGETALPSVSLPKATAIARSAFYNNPSLASVDLPEVTEVGYNVCTYANSESNDSDYSDKGVFEDCPLLTSVNLPKVTRISYYSFANCTSLAEINLPLVYYIGDEVFWGCTSLTDINLPLVREIGDKAFSRCTSLTDISIPNAKQLGISVFDMCENLENVELSNVEKVMDYAFNATKIHSLDLPKASQITSNAFSGMNQLTALSLTTENHIRAIYGYAFKDFNADGFASDQCSLTLHKNKQNGGTVTPSVAEDGVTWAGVPWKSIQYVGE